MRLSVTSVARVGAALGLLCALVAAGGKTSDSRLSSAPPDDVRGLTEYLRQARLDHRKVPGYLEAYLWWLQHRAGPDGKIDWAQRDAAMERHRRLRPSSLGKRGLQTVEGNWEFVGPKQLEVPYRQYFGQGILSGRVNALAVDPGNAAVWYLGAAGGGLWKTSNSGRDWTCLSDEWPTQEVSSVAVHPTNSQIILVGTGDYHGKPNARGWGLMRSTDGGATWTRRLNPFDRVSDLLFLPDTPNTVYAAAHGTGLSRSNDAGDTWQVADIDSFYRFVEYLDISPPLPNGRRLISAIDASSNDVTLFLAWDRNAPGSFGFRFNRFWSTYDAAVQEGAFDIAASQQEPGVFYFLDGFRRRVHRLTYVSNQPMGDQIISGAFPDDDAPNDNYNWSQAWYDYYIKCAQVGGSERIFVGLIDLVQSGNKGVSWESVGKTYQPDALTHNDQHVLAAHSGGVLIGNDGGVYRATAGGGGSWSIDTTLNGTLGITQFYHAGYHPTLPNVMLGGTQDNATPAVFGNLEAWRAIGGGDGGQVAVDPRNGDHQYLTIVPGPTVTRTTDRWANPVNMTPAGNFGNEGRGFVTPVALNTANPQRFHVGAERVWTFRSELNNWVSSTTVLAAGEYITALAAAPSNANRLYAGTWSGRVWTSANGGGTWTQIDDWPATGNQLFPDYKPRVTSISIHPSKPNEILVTVNAQYGGSLTQGELGRIWKYDGAWTRVIGAGASAYPELQTNWICRDPWAPDTNWYAANDAGVLETTDGGATWLNATTPLGLPNVQVNHIEAVSGTGYLMAATYGRGIWRIPLQAPKISGRVRMGDGSALSGVVVSAGNSSDTSAADGTYTIEGAGAGTMTVTPSKAGFAFDPLNRQVTLGASATGIDFTARSTATYSLSGRVTLDGAGLQNVTVQINGPGGATSLTTGADGSYSKTGLQPGSYTVTPERQHFTFTPTSRNVNLTQNTSGVSFTAAHVLYTVSGRITHNGGGLASVNVVAAGPAGNRQSTTDGNGNYTLTQVRTGTYTVTPTRSGFGFTPVNRSVNVTANTTGIDFTAASQTFAIAGNVRADGKGVAGVTITAKVGSEQVQAVTTSDGKYTIAGLPSATYTVTPAKKGLTFNPASRQVTIGPSQDNIDFTVVAERPPAAPTQLAIVAKTKSSLTLSWFDRADNERSFHIEQLKGRAWTEIFILTNKDIQAWNVGRLKKNTKYSFRVRAWNDAGFSAYTNVATGKTKKK